ncbi:Nonsense-mediated mRNA decay factor SMG7 [Linum grandiflorum]
MIVQMDKMSAPSSRERAQRLYEKNIELENKRRRSAQARVPSDPNAWQQMRENYESIILEDHGFSEQHNIEYALWQLHYRRIEELRAHLSGALNSAASNSSQAPARPDRIQKIRSQFKTFLSEATGFYHDLILKIRAKYGLPLGFFTDGSDDRVVMEKDEKKSADIKKGLISCHRCLIYLGDLVRYKGLYGEGDSKTREYAAASSYYLQAASLWPSSGNPHHQLAILASYSGDELVAVYRYFRSLAVDNPFMTARDNLIVAFEKNRQSYSHLVGDVKASPVKESGVRGNGRGRGKAEPKGATKSPNLGADGTKEKTIDIKEIRKSFCTRFVRLNGILFTRTSLEMFTELLASVSCTFSELLSTGPNETLNFGSDAVENGHFIVHLISILVFTVHNVKKEAEGQTYAEIVQRAVVLQHAFTAAFELMGHLLARCEQLNDPSSSYLLPGILVFVEWLACCPDVAAVSDADEKQVAVRANFWRCCIAFMNKILTFSSMSLDDNEDDTCFNNMSRYEEGETENRLALWEDFELRGFLPLIPAQMILDFSRKHSFGTEGRKERMARFKRILAAGKALANIVKVDQKSVSFDSKMKKFVIGAVHVSSGELFNSDLELSKASDMVHELKPEEAATFGVLNTDPQTYVEEDEDDEVIVFKPLVAEKQDDGLHLKHSPCESMRLNYPSSADLQFYGGSVSGPLDDHLLPAAFNGLPKKSPSPGIVGTQNPPEIHPPSSKWLMEEAALVANNLKSVRFVENGHATDHGMKTDFGVAQLAPSSVTSQQPSVNISGTGMFYNQMKVPDAIIPSKVDAVASPGIFGESLGIQAAAAAPSNFRRSPVSRPVRHLGPPPGFTSVPQKQVAEPISGSDMINENPLADDYSWLDGYQLPSSTKASMFSGPTNISSHPTIQYASNNNGFTGVYASNNNGFTGVGSIPFPGKQLSTSQVQLEKERGWENYQAFENLRAQEEQLQQQQQLLNGNQQMTPEQFRGQSIWNGGRYIV